MVLCWGVYKSQNGSIFGWSLCHTGGGGDSPVSALSKTVNDSQRRFIREHTTYIQRGELRTNKQNSSCNCQLCVYSQDATNIYPPPSCVYSMCVMSRSCIIPPVVRLYFVLFLFPYYQQTNGQNKKTYEKRTKAFFYRCNWPVPSP
jgi:hypothetical protein